MENETVINADGLFEDHVSICEECKGSNVQLAIWINPNTKSYCGDFEGEWCDDCEKHVDFEYAIREAK